MIKKSLYAFWGFMFILCAALGFIPVSSAPARTAMVLISLIAFLPPAGLLWLGYRQQDPDSLRLVRNLALVSLVLTLAALVLNFLAAGFFSRQAGDILHTVLVLVSSPMFCSQFWILSLALWATLLWTGIFLVRKLK